MAHRKEDRYPTCLDLQADLEGYLASLPGAKGLKPIVGYMQMLFAEPRAERQSLIERQLAKAELLSTDEYSALRGSLPPGASLPLISAARSESDPQLPIGQSLYPDLASSSGATMSRSRVSAPERRGGRKIAFLLLGLVMFAGLGAVSLLLRKGSDSIASRGEADTSSKAPTTGSQEDPPKPTDLSRGLVATQRVTLFVRAEPSSAKIFLDDSAMATDANPQALSLSKNSVHTLRAEAKGYVTKSITVTLEADKEALVVLDREKADTTPWRPPSRGTKGTGSAQPAKEPASVEPAPVQAGGFLTIDTYPWTVVSEGGKSLGQTPIVHLPLPAGDHVLVLENPEQGLKQTYPVTIKSGETLNRRLGLK